MKSLPYSAHVCQPKAVFWPNHYRTRRFSITLVPDPLARMRFSLHNDVRAAGIRILSTQRIGAAGIRILSTQTLYIKKIFPLRGLKSLEIL